jgi:hypothetical protein
MNRCDHCQTPLSRVRWGDDLLFCTDCGEKVHEMIGMHSFDRTYWESKGGCSFLRTPAYEEALVKLKAQCSQCGKVHQA